MRKLSDWITSYLQFNSFNEAPEVFHFWTAVSTIAAALRRQVYIDQVYFTWTPNFYIVLVAKPGLLTKSTCISIGEEMLLKLGTIKLGPAAITWQALIQLMEACNEMVLMPDGTYMPMSCVSLFTSELGTLIDFEDKKLMDVMVDLWDGKKGAWEKHTVGGGAKKVTSPWINIIAGCTPAWLSTNVPRSVMEGGFISRCLFVHASRKANLIAYPKFDMPKSNISLKDSLIHDLEAISNLKGEFTISQDAVDFGRSCYGDIYKQMLGPGADETGYLARKFSHIHKLAMVISASRGDSMVIDKQDLQKALTVMDTLQGQLPEVMKAVQTTNHGNMKGKILATLQAHGGSLTKAKLYQSVSHMMSSREFQDIIASGVMAGEWEDFAQGNTMFVRIL